ncbi:hypothetical protein [Vagococcus silagei]|uniref:Uncharacterized protein n=1 Tax=Vagococcus silagei TaxID=2508885 RepID=A0A4S3B0V1_9ENTE|nr:hypothetical protein [Vagococcus silagei]THB60641.1 hypothetical protein ESZ54_09240 [Vagococcus silagei]
MGKKVLRLMSILMVFIGMIGFSQKFDAATGISNESALKRAMSSGADGEYFLENSFSFSKTVEVKGNKVLDLNNQTLSTGTGTSDQFEILDSNSEFTLKNGTVTGGNTANVGGSGSGFILAKAKVLNNKIYIENITHTSEGGFILANGSDVYFNGINNATNGRFNVRAGNMYFESGKFTGTTTTSGSQNPNSTGSGGINLSFNGYKANLRSGKDRDLIIEKDAEVILDNKNTSSLNYANNIGNFDYMKIKGILNATAVGTSLRTTAAHHTLGDGKNKSGRSEIHVEPGSTFKVSSTADGSNKYGTLYTYSTGLYVNNPKTFDMRYFADGLFFYHWPQGPKGYFDVKNMDIAVWDKESRGIGNPRKENIWQDVEQFTIDGFDDTKGERGRGVVTSSIPDLANRFDINTYSRISNDVRLPKIEVDDVKQIGDTYQISNASRELKGSVNYVLPDGSKVGGVANANVKVTIGGRVFETETDEAGKWSFPYSNTHTSNSINFSSLSGGSAVTFDVVDKDKRVDQAKGVIVDDIAPKGKGKLLIVDQNSEEGTGANRIPKDPKLALASYSDETTSTSGIKVNYQTLESERKELTKELGYYPDRLKVSIKDDANNENIVPIPVLVKKSGETIKDSYATATDFTYDYNDWKKATTEERKAIVREQGNVKVYDVNQSTYEVTEVPNDSPQVSISWNPEPWEPKSKLPIKITYKSYTRPIEAYLDVKEVKMKVNYYLAGTETPIYSNLESKDPKAGKTIERIVPGNSIDSTLTDLIASGEIDVMSDYYNLTTPKYKVYVDGAEVASDTVPGKDFTVNYQFSGVIMFDKVGKIDFGKFNVAKSTSEHKAASTTLPSQELTIVNTIPNEKWRLSAKMDEAIENKNNNRKFHGRLLFNDYILNDSGLDVMTQAELDTPLTVINLGDVLELQQKSGNLRGQYEGKIEWSLVSGPLF